MIGKREMWNWLKRRRFFGGVSDSYPEYEKSPNARSGDYLTWLTGPNTEADIVVTPETAKECVPFWAAVNFLSTSLANLPVHMYSRGMDGSKERMHGPQEDVVGKFWNDSLTAYEGFRWIVQQMCLHGVAYVRVYRMPTGEIANLYPLETDQVEVTRYMGEKYYEYHPRETGFVHETLLAREILEFPYFEHDDMYSVASPVWQCRNAIGLSLAIESYASAFFRNGGVPPLIVKRKMEMSAEAGKRMRKQLNARMKEARRNRELITDIPDWEIVDPKVVTPMSAQMIEARRYCTEEISRILGVPPILINDLSKGTYANTEQQDTQFVKHTLSKLAKQFESQLNLKLFDRDTSMFFEFDMRAVERGLFRERIEGLARQVQTGMLTPNEARSVENLPPSDEENADKLFMQSATTPLESATMELELKQQQADAAMEAAKNPPAAEPAGDQGNEGSDNGNSDS